MLNLRANPLAPARSLLRLNSVRNVFVLSHERRQRLKTQREKLQDWSEKDDARKAKKAEAEYTRKMKELRKLTSSASQHLRSQEKLRVQQLKEAKKAAAKEKGDGLDHDSNSTTDPAQDASKEAALKPLLLFASAIEIPDAILERLGLGIKYLVSKDHQNWRMVMQHLKANGGFGGLSQKDVRKFVYAIPRKDLIFVFQDIEECLTEANMPVSPKIVNTYLKALVQGNTISQARLKLLETYVEGLRAQSSKSVLSRDTYEILIEAYGKAKDMQKMDAIIVEMRSRGLAPTANVYSNVLTTCVYKNKDHKQAVQLFELMKFLAGSMAPGAREYQDIIVSYIIHDDVEKALDVYQDMLGNRLEPTQSVLVALARGCMRRTLLKQKAWDFIFEIYRRGWKPTVQTLEYMLYLAAVDGDLALARALYQQLSLTGSCSPRSFGFLMLAYSKFDTTRDGTAQIPAILLLEEGRDFRVKILDGTDLVPDLSDPRKATPFLPKQVLTSTAEVMAEASAIITHALVTELTFINTQNVNTFLDISARYGTFGEFKQAFEEFTYLDASGIPKTRIIEEEIPEIVELSEHETKVELHPSITKSPLLVQIGDMLNRHKVKRDSVTYVIALKAAARHSNYEFSQTIWQERGNFRKSDEFRQLTPAERDKQDFRFAAAMVSCLTDLKLLEDALAVVVSTEYQFKWTWNELRSLQAAASVIRHDKITSTINGITKRAQITFEGKIRRKDYKRYVMERGY